MPADGAATRTRADAHNVRALRGATVTFNDTKTTHSITPYSECYSQHSSRIVATNTGFKTVNAHAGRCTGKCVAVMEARKRRLWDRSIFRKTHTRRELIIRQRSDNKRLWLHPCTTNPCITVLIAMRCHGLQAPGFRDQSTLAQPQETQAAVDHHKDQQLPQ